MSETIEVKKACGLCMYMPDTSVSCYEADKHVNKGLIACEKFKLHGRYTAEVV